MKISGIFQCFSASYTLFLLGHEDATAPGPAAIFAATQKVIFFPSACLLCFSNQHSECQCSELLQNLCLYCCKSQRRFQFIFRTEIVFFSFHAGGRILKPRFGCNGVSAAASTYSKGSVQGSRNYAIVARVRNI